MVTQLLFGEAVKIYEEKKGNWQKIKTAYDNYPCWVDIKQITEISEEEFNKTKTSPSTICSELVRIIKKNADEALTPIVLGSSLPSLKKKTIHIGAKTFHFEGQVVNLTKKLGKGRLAENAFMYLNAPYLWGGRSPFGIDCSGFTQIIYKLNGFPLPRDASQQAEIGATLSFIEESESGDLAFFDNEEGKIIHVGIMLANNKIIHASGKVRIDKIDHQGIYNVDTNTYSHRLRLIKKVL